MRSTTCAPIPMCGHPSSTTTARLVFLTDSRMAASSRGRNDLEAGNMGDPALPRLGVLRPELECGATRAPEHDGDPNLPTRHVQHLCRGIDDLVQRELRDGSIDHAFGAELLQQSAAHLVRALIDADFFTHQKHVLIALHLLSQRLVQGISIGESRHGQSASTSVYSSSGSGSGLSSANLTAASTSAWISASMASSAA